MSRGHSATFAQPTQINTVILQEEPARVRELKKAVLLL